MIGTGTLSFLGGILSVNEGDALGFGAWTSDFLGGYCFGGNCLISKWGNTILGFWFKLFSEIIAGLIYNCLEFVINLYCWACAFSICLDIFPG